VAQRGAARSRQPVVLGNSLRPVAHRPKYNGRRGRAEYVGAGPMTRRAEGLIIVAARMILILTGRLID
jgi:hypothetical protein